MNQLRRIYIVRHPNDQIAAQPPVTWALGELERAMNGHSVSIRYGETIAQTSPDETCIVVAGAEADLARPILNAAGVSIPDAAESLGLIPGKVDNRSVLLACGHDVRGIVYAILELVDRAIHANNLTNLFDFKSPIVEQPANPIRSIARLFTSDLEDKAWFYDRNFWQRYLSMLIFQRFNRFSLTLGLGYNFPRHVRDAYFYFAYPFLLSVPGYQVRVKELSDEERDRNLETLRFISDETAKRGLHFQLAIWTHAYEWLDSPEANYTIEGLNPQNHAAYCRDALRQLLEACPAIAGVTFRIHGESGIPERSYDFWKTVFDGIVQCGRKVEIDMHAKGMDWEMIEVALSTGMPVNVSPKYWAEHMGLPYHQASIRQQERPPREKRDDGFMAISGGSRRFLRYGYGDLLTEDRGFGVLYRIWPGTQRLLLWGDPAMASGYGRYSNFCGCSGVELCEPLSFKGRMGSGLAGSRDGYANPSLHPAGGDWEKYLYTYRLWGRLLYNPDADSEVWRRYLRKEFGAAAQDVERALANASRVLLLITTAHHPSASNNAYWPEIYTNMPIVDETRGHPYGDTPSPKKFGKVSSLDPELFSSIDEFADELIQRQLSGKFSPLDVANWLEEFCEAADRHLAEAKAKTSNGNDPSFRRLAIDVALQSGIGRFFAQKLKAGVWYALYERTHDVPALEQALAAYRLARETWAELAKQAEDVYVKDLTFGLNTHLRGHWTDRLPAIDQDIQDMEKRLEEAKKQTSLQGEDKEDKDRAETAREFLSLVTVQSERQLSCEHTPPDSFQRGKPVDIEATVRAAKSRRGSRRSVFVRLHYRRVNQAENYVVVDMQKKGNRGHRYSATIPGDYSDSPYPLQYFFEVRDDRGRAWLYPGFDADLSNQPYYVLRYVGASR